MSNTNIHTLIQSLQYGIKVNTNFGVLSVPSPKVGVLYFHKRIRKNRYVTLQANTNLINDKITKKEIETISNKIGEVGHLKTESCIVAISKYSFLFIFLTAFILFPVPFIMASKGIQSFFLSILYLILLILFLIFIKNYL